VLSAQQGARKKKPEDQNLKKGSSSHSLISVNSSLDAWIVDSRASHHMATTKELYSSLDACKGPPILMGGNSPIEVTRKGRIELTNGSFENVLHAPKLFDNLLSLYQMTNFDTGMKFIFTPNVVDIYDMQTNSRCNIPRPNPIVNVNTNVRKLVSCLISFLYAPSMV
jgi:hypothetical protein